MTLGEIGENDLAMVEDAIKNANKHIFPTKIHARDFIRQCMDATLNHVGIKVINPPKPGQDSTVFEKWWNEQLKEKNVKIETRKKYQDENMWRNGIYIFKDNVLVAFISNVFMKGTFRAGHGETMKEKLKTTSHTEGFFVITNALTDNTQRVYGGSSKPKSLILPPSSRN
jgi:hypothetical protein